MQQRSFGSVEYEHKKVKTRRQTFLERMDRLVPWAELEQRIAPVYPKPGRGRRSSGSTSATPAWSRNSTTPVRCSSSPVSASPSRFPMRRRSAPSSTKNRERARDPEMHQTRKGRQWYFGMKLHTGTDARSGLVHSLHTTAANVSDVTEAHRLLHGAESAVWGDAGYRGAEKRPEHAGSGVSWQVAMRPGLRRQLLPGGAEARAERRKASVRAKAEHPFLYVKRHFGYAQVRYRGLEKNRRRLALLLGFANLLRAEPQLA